MNEANMPTQTAPTPCLDLLEDVTLDVPFRWHGERTIHVRDLEGNDAMMTVALEAVSAVIRAASRQDQYGAAVDVWVDASGLHIIDVCVW